MEVPLGETSPEIVRFVDSLTDYVTELGYLNDRRLAEGLLNSYRRRGDAQRLIRQKLKKKGIPAAIIAETLSGHTEENELASALRFVEKKRLTKDWETLDFRGRQRILQRLARRGFSYGVATKALEMARDG
ncbi:MAG: regulatory protein RecX [Bradymonadia bacterium]